MIDNKKLYIYSGVAIGLSILGYFVITSKNKSSIGTDGNNSIDDSEIMVTTTTGSDVSQAQVQIPSTLQKVLAKTSAQSTKMLIGKNVYTKIDNVNARTQNYVNNGIINNTFGGVITPTGTLIGTIIEVVDDQNKLSNSTGQVYKWFKVKPSNDAIKSINSTQSWFNTPLLNTFPSFYVREDTLTLNK